MDNRLTLDLFRNERNFRARRLETAQVAVERAQHDAACAVHVPVDDDTVHEGQALPFRSRQQSLRATGLLNRPAEGANMTRRPGSALLHDEERWRWPLRRPVKSIRSHDVTFVYDSQPVQSQDLARSLPRVLVGANP